MLLENYKAVLEGEGSSEQNSSHSMKNVEKCEGTSLSDCHIAWVQLSECVYSPEKRKFNIAQARNQGS